MLLTGQDNPALWSGPVMAPPPAQPATPFEWLTYSNQGATRSQPLAPELVNALLFLEDMGIRMDVFSGGQPPAGSRFARVGSVRHDNGMAADAVFYDATGRRLDWNNPDDVQIFQEIVRRGREAGITGFGAGEGYMIPGSMHIGFGNEAVWGAGGRSENAAPWLVEAFNAATGQAANGQPVTASAQPQGGQPPMQQQQPTGLLGTMSTMSSPTQQDPGGWSIWDAISGRLPERAQGIAGRTIGNADWRDRMAIALAGMSMRPNTALIETLQGRMDERADMRKVNATVEWLTSIGRTDLAEAVAAGSLMGDQAAAIAMSPPPQEERTALMQNYEFLISQGYTPEQALASLQSGTVVNVGDEAGPQVGTIPPGFALVEDAQNPSGYRLEIVPGGPADLERQAADAEAIAADARTAVQGEQGARSASVVIDDIGRLTQLIENAPWYNPAVGTGSGLLEGIRGTNAADAAALASTINANIAFDRLQQMREASPTGGALGAVTERELALLSSVMGSLDQSQSQEQFLQNLERLNTIYSDIINKFAAYPNAAEFGIVGPEGSIGVTTLPPVQIDGYTIQEVQ